MTRASDSGPGLQDRPLAGAGDLWDSAGELWDDAGDATGNLVDTVGDTFNDVSTWAAGRWDTTSGNVTDSVRNLWGTFDHTGGFLTGEPPSFMELTASVALLHGNVINTAATLGTAGQYNPHIFDDGSPSPGDPISVHVSADGMGPTSDGHLPSYLPSSLEAIAGNTANAYSDGQPSYIVDIPCTQSWNPLAEGTPSDLTGNLVTGSGQQSTASQSVALALEQAGIQPGDPVMLSGHSQGGMTAASLTADESFMNRYNVTNVMTFGSPVDAHSIPPGVDMIGFQHSSDVVPRLDLGGLRVDGSSPSNGATAVVLPNPEGATWHSAVGNHDYNSYAQSIGTAEQNTSNPASTYANQQSTRHFLSNDPTQVESYVIPIERRH